MILNHLNKIILIALFVFISGCHFEKILQPGSAQSGEIIDIKITVIDNLVPEPNPHKGVLCILMPQDWTFISGNYASAIGSGSMNVAQNWADSAEACYPSADFRDNMTWLGLISDIGYTYQEALAIEINIRLKVGQRQGCFQLGYLVTKATADLICSGNPSWAPFSYPHRIGVPDADQCGDNFEVERAPAWDAMFDRTSGWTGSDAAYSIPLSGYDAPGGDQNQRTLFVFGDTFISDVDSTGRRSNIRFLNNTYAVLDTLAACNDQIQFFWDSVNGYPATVFVPHITTGEWYWPMDGIYVNDKIYLFGLRLTFGSGGVFNFVITGVSLLKFQLDDDDQLINYEEKDAPLFYRDDDGSEIVLGQAVMPLTEDSGNPHADGYIYVYGPRNTSQQKELVAARVLPHEIESFEQWEFWNGNTWSANIQDCAAITDQISQEFSLTPCKDGRFVLVFSLADNVAIRIGESPVGPFAFYEIVYNCPEPLTDPAIITYNAKAHPHLSAPDKLLIGYNVNTFDNDDHITNADIYRPRFITLQLHSANIDINSDADSTLPESFALYPNFPNPFNPKTAIRYKLVQNANVRLSVFNIKGEEVKILVNQYQSPGLHTTSWDGKNGRSENVSSGIYFYKILVNGKISNGKMLLLR